MRFGRESAIELARAADRILTTRGPRPVAFDLRKDPPDDDALAAHLLGPTGNLRAPTLRVGATLVVGFNETHYRAVLEATPRRK